MGKKVRKKGKPVKKAKSRRVAQYRLGFLLIQKFKQPKSRPISKDRIRGSIFSPLNTRSTSSKKNLKPIANLPKVRSKKLHKKKVILRISQMQGLSVVESQREPAPIPAQTEPVPVAQVIQEAPQVVQEVESPPSSQLMLQLVPEPTPAGSTAAPQFHRALTVQDLIKPNEKLKQSIEAFLLDQRSPHTRRAYGKDLKRLVQFLMLRKYEGGIESLNRTVLISYKEFLIAEGLEHTSIDRHIATLRSFFKWLVDDGIIEKNPAEGVRFLSPKRVSRTIGFSDEEVRKVLSIPDLHTKIGSLHYAVLMVLFYCGLRRSEVCELRTTYISQERNQHVLRLRGKGNAERIVVLIPAVWNAIKYYFHITNRNLSSDQYLFLPMRNNRTGVLNKPLDPSTIFYIVTKCARKAGISNRVSPHSCRATAISNARDHHVPDRAIQEFAGWASPDMITRYDKRKTSVENSAAHSIKYGSENRTMPDLTQIGISITEDRE